MLRRVRLLFILPCGHFQLLFILPCGHERLQRRGIVEPTRATPDRRHWSGVCMALLIGYWEPLPLHLNGG